MRIPGRVNLPFGYVISVKQLKQDEMNRVSLSDADGGWNVDIRTIYILKTLPITRKRYILAHELGHAWLDWQHHHLNNGQSKT